MYDYNQNNDNQEAILLNRFGKVRYGFSYYSEEPNIEKCITKYI
jgi:hypothetical protein